MSVEPPYNVTMRLAIVAYCMAQGWQKDKAAEVANRLVDEDELLDLPHVMETVDEALQGRWPT